ncbi:MULTISPECIES: hypothetical protein [Paenibacillus]|uniref:hypothetical protein n=1 Tax=Paenibacillus TaxID=44249 RepID=UPI00117EE680|nr:MULTISPECIES: hypothetical protein [Paenibacillus]
MIISKITVNTDNQSSKKKHQGKGRFCDCRLLYKVERQELRMTAQEEARNKEQIEKQNEKLINEQSGHQVKHHMEQTQRASHFKLAVACYLHSADFC